MTKRRILVATVLVALPVTLTACGRDEAPAGTDAPGVAPRLETAVAEERTVADSIEASGQVKAWRRVSPGTKLMGRVERLEVREGERVSRGQLLAKLEDRDLRAAVEQARAGIAMAQAQLVNAAAQHARMTELHGRGSATRKNLEDAVAARDLAEAALTKGRADLAAAEATLGYAEIRSPIDGWVVTRNVEQGDMSVPGMAFFTIENLERVKVSVRVPERDVVGLAAGQPAEVVIDVLDEVVEATIHRVAPAGDPASRTFEVELGLDNPEGRIRSGMFARARFKRGERAALLLPIEAVVRRGQLEGVFVVSEGRVALRWIKTGQTVGGKVEVLSGLQSGERYVSPPPPGLRDGARVGEDTGA